MSVLLYKVMLKTDSISLLKMKKQLMIFACFPSHPLYGHCAPFTCCTVVVSSLTHCLDCWLHLQGISLSELKNQLMI